MLIEELLATLPPIRRVDRQWIARAEVRQLSLTKPPGSLGRLEEIANRVAAIQQTLTPTIGAAQVIVFAGDHGVTAEGVAPYPSAVTAQMVTNFLAGGAAINALAAVAGAGVTVVDIGVAADAPPVTGVHGRRIAQGTKNFAHESAMTSEEVLAALAVGIEQGLNAATRVDMIGLGEMGIGNSTAASAITAALTGLPPTLVTGRGTAADDEMVRRKIAVITEALKQRRPNARDALDVLAKVGGLEIAGLVGVVLAGAATRRVIVTDGFIATAAAALAVRLCPETQDYLFAAHRSVEPGHAALLELIGQEPLLDLRMRLGEGTGAALAFTVIRAAVAAFSQMATFASAGVSDRPA